MRQALYQAIDIEAIHRTTMRGQSVVHRHAVPAAGQWLRPRPRMSGCRSMRPGRGAAGRGRLSERLRDHPRLPEQPLHQRRADLPGGDGDVGAGRRAGAARIRCRSRPSSPRSSATTPRVSARLGRADARCVVFASSRWCVRATAGRATASGTTGGYCNPRMDELIVRMQTAVGRAAQRGDPRGAGISSRGRPAHSAAPADDPLGDAVNLRHPAHGGQPALFRAGCTPELTQHRGRGGIGRPRPPGVESHVRLHHPSHPAGHPGHARRGADRLRDVPLCRRPGGDHARAGLHRGAARRAARTTWASTSRSGCSSRPSSAMPLHGDFGLSYRQSRPVAELIAERAAGHAGTGLLRRRAGARRSACRWASIPACTANSWLSRFFLTFSLIGVSLPTFLIGILLILVFSV